MREYREFNVGDKVRVVNEPYEDCPFAWVSDMDEMCGELVTISYKGHSAQHNTYYYKVSEAEWTWCGNCFVAPEDIEEDFPEIEDESFLSVIYGGGEAP